LTAPQLKKTAIDSMKYASFNKIGNAPQLEIREAVIDVRQFFGEHFDNITV
jgi:hypothetical protein